MPCVGSANDMVLLSGLNGACPAMNLLGKESGKEIHDPSGQ